MLYDKYRPKTLEDFVGNKEQIERIRSMLARDRKDLPHSFLFTGPAGTGKTSMARVIAQELGCKGGDLVEMNSANFRGIDTARDLIASTRYRPNQSPYRVWIIDECFIRGSKVETPSGRKNIEDMQPGDSIYSLAGVDSVKHRLVNQVSLDRIVKIRFSDGSEIISTKQHEFFTSHGWIEAGDLQNGMEFFGFQRHFMETIDKKETRNGMSDMPQGVHFEIREPGMLVGMQEKSCTSEEQQENGAGDLHNMRKAIHADSKKQDADVLETMRKRMASEMPKETEDRRSEREDKEELSGVLLRSRTESGSQNGPLGKNEGKQSSLQSRSCGKDKGDPQTSWNSGHDKELSGRERENHPATKASCRSSKFSSRTSNIFRRAHTRISDLLQGGSGLSRKETRNRSRRELSPFASRYLSRCEKDEETKRIRVESVESYKPGSSGGFLKDHLTDQEIARGFVEFYDLEVERDHSYFVQGIPVHNCHKWTKDAQEASLKLLEDTPNHVILLLCTTDPDMLLKTVRSRCTEIAMSPITDKGMMRLLSRIMNEEGKEIPEEVLNQIILDSTGCARLALVILDSIMDLEPDSMLKAAKRNASVENKSIELCRALTSTAKPGWKEIMSLVRGISEEPEKIRRSVLGYCSAIMESYGDPSKAGWKRPSEKDIFRVMAAFEEPYFNTGRPGLIMSCYRAMRDNS